MLLSRTRSARAVGLPSAQLQRPIQFTDAQADAIRVEQQPVPVQVPALAVRRSSAQLSLPLFDNFNREERVQQAAVEPRRRGVQRARRKDLALTADVTQAYLTLRTAAQTVALQEQNAAKAQEELAFAEERYKVGAVHLPRRRHVARHVRAGADRPHQRRLRLPQGLRRARERGRPSPPLTPPRDSIMSKRVKWSVAGGVVLVIVADRRADRRRRARTRRSRCASRRCERARPRRVRHGERTGPPADQGRPQLRHHRQDRPARGARKARWSRRASSCSRSIRSRHEAAVQRVEAALASSARAGGAGAGQPAPGAAAATSARPQIKKTNPQLISRRAARAAPDAGRGEQGAARGGAPLGGPGAARRVRDARSSLGKTTIYAPMSGRVTRLNVERARRRSWARSTRTRRRCSRSAT